MAPIDDFTKIRIVPTLEELKQEGKPFLRAVPKGKAEFKDWKDYLDLIFRILREDAILPLRKGLFIMQR